MLLGCHGAEGYELRGFLVGQLYDFADGESLLGARPAGNWRQDPVAPHGYAGFWMRNPAPGAVSTGLRANSVVYTHELWSGSYRLWSTAGWPSST